MQKETDRLSALNSLGITIPGVYEVFEQDGAIIVQDATDDHSLLTELEQIINYESEQLGLRDEIETLDERLTATINLLKSRTPTELTAGVYAIDKVQAVERLMDWTQYNHLFSKMPGDGGFYFRLQQLISRYLRLENQRLETIEAIRKYLGSILLIVDSLADKIPHREKDARVGALVSIIHKALDSISFEYNEYATNFYREFPDLFGVTHLVRPYLETIRNLEKEIKALKGDPPSVDDDHPF